MSLDDSRPTLEELALEIQVRDRRIRDLTASNEILEAQVKQGREELHTLYRSRSWRITAPLRNASAKLDVFRAGATKYFRNYAGALRQALGNRRTWTMPIRLLRRMAHPREASRLKVARSQRPRAERRTNERTPLDHPAQASGQQRRDTMLAVTHLIPFPPRAGNEYRLFRLLRWIRSQGRRVILVVCPLRDTDATEVLIEECRAMFTEIIICHRDGRVRVQLDEPEAVLASLRGLPISGPWQDADEALRGADHLKQLERTFCPDALVALMVRLNHLVSPSVVLCTYIFMTRLLPALGDGPRKIIDTIDVFSSKRDKVLRFGIHDASSVTAEDERERLLRADLVLAIQEEEAAALSALVPEREVIAVGVDFDAVPETYARLPAKPRVLFVGSDNPMNEKGLRDFLDFAWPLVSRALPETRLVVAGKVCRVVSCNDVNVYFVGETDDLEPLYREAKVVINPAVAGTGLKIKTIEALSHWRPVVTWPAGVDGLYEPLVPLCCIAKDWYAFYLELARVLRSDCETWYSPSERAQIRSALSPEKAYHGLREAIGLEAELEGTA